MLYRPPPDFSLERLEPQIRKATSRLLGKSVLQADSTSIQNVGVHFIRKDQPAIIGKSGSLVLRLPILIDPESRRRTHLAVKVELSSRRSLTATRKALKAVKRNVKRGNTSQTEKDILIAARDVRLEMLKKNNPTSFAVLATPVYSPTNPVEISLRRLVEEGYPVAVPLTVQIGPRSWVIVQHDLTEGGKFKLFEAHTFDFSKLENGDELRKVFEGFTSKKRVASLFARLVRGGRHIRGLDDVSALGVGLRRSFFVRRQAGSSKGELVFGDTDNLLFPFDFK